jgi:hypothetical protein
VKLVRLLVLNPTSALKARGWLKTGIEWGEALARLHAEAKVDQ